MLGRYHALGPLEGWILVKAEDPKALYEHVAEWAEFLDWKTIPELQIKKLAPFAQNLQLNKT